MFNNGLFFVTAQPKNPTELGISGFNGGSTSGNLTAGNWLNLSYTDNANSTEHTSSWFFSVWIRGAVTAIDPPSASVGTIFETDPNGLQAGWLWKSGSTIYIHSSQDKDTYLSINNLFPGEDYSDPGSSDPSGSQQFRPQSGWIHYMFRINESELTNAAKYRVWRDGVELESPQPQEPVHLKGLLKLKCECGSISTVSEEVNGQVPAVVYCTV